MDRWLSRPSTPARPDALLAWMGSLADPTRLRILRVLEREELSVLELCEVLKLPQSTVSRHLKTLGDQGWVASRREGTQAFYRGAPHSEPGAQRLWRLARAETEGWPAVEQDALRLEARQLIDDDLAEIDDLEYYTGVMCTVYSPSLNRELGKGGRYDTLMREFGRDLPAIGFSLSLDALLELP